MGYCEYTGWLKNHTLWKYRKVFQAIISLKKYQICYILSEPYSIKARKSLGEHEIEVQTFTFDLCFHSLPLSTNFQLSYHNLKGTRNVFSFS